MRPDRRRSSRPAQAAAAVGLAVALGAGACTNGDGRYAVTRGSVSLTETVLASLTRLDSCADTEARLRSAATAAARTGRFGTWGGDVMTRAAEGVATADDGAEAIPESAPAATAQGGGTADEPFSTTNVQEAGVDEPDLVKTDGETIYVLRDGTVRVLDAATLDELATIAPEPGGEAGNLWFSNLLLHDDVLVVLGDGSGQHAVLGGAAAEDGISRAPEIWRPATVLTRYDVSDPAAPALVDRIVVDGATISARLVGGVARIVTNDSGAGGVPMPEPLARESADDYQDRVVDSIESAPVEAFLPAYTVVDAAGDVVASGTAVDCDQVYVPSYETGPSTLAVHTLDLDGAFSPGDGVAVLAGGQTVYASADRLYVATSRFSGDTLAFFDGDVLVDRAVGAPSAGSGEAVAEDDDVAEPPTETPGEAPAEEVAPTVVVEFPEPAPEPTEPEPLPVEPEPIAPPEPPSVTTELHAFDIAGDGPADYLGSGQVVGTVLNQFSMSHHDGVLRVATTDEGWGGPQSQSYVTTFRLEGGELVQVGQVGGLGRGERIYAVRFLGTTGYVVTFRQVDPLYTLDLSDPADPTVVGELKIGGYSAYLHPTVPGRLLGLGQDATLEGRRLGTQLSLFDVADPAAPARLSQVAFGANSESSAEYDHHAFLWWAPANLIVVPFHQWSVAPDDGVAEGFAGAVLVRVEGDTLREVGRISHRAAATSGPRFADDTWMTTIERSLVIGDRLVTISQLGIAAHDLDTLAELTLHRFQG